jgi:GxxExxY protein
MIRPYDEVEGVANRVIGCAIEVHRVLGAGLLESVYHECLVAELKLRGLSVETQKWLAIDYKGLHLPCGLKVDVIVERCLIVELKAVESLHPVHQAQLITYLKLTGCPAGLLVNFNEVLLKNGLRRLDHPERYASKKQKSGRTKEK